jgi:zinc protease
MRQLRILTLFLVALSSCSAEAQKEAPADPPPLGKVDFPAYEKRVLPNGLTVYAIEHREQPIVALRLVITAGAANDPAALPGVASFVADLLNQGTKARSATRIAEAIDQVGGTLEASADMESTTVSAGVLKDNVGLAFELMNDIVQNPAFAAEEIARLQEQSLSGLSAAMEDPDFVADAVLERAMYAAHPYAHPEDGTMHSIPAIKRDDLAKFHTTFYAPNISALAIVGDLSTAEAFKLAEQWFGSWAKKEVPPLPDPEVPKLTNRRIVIIDKPDAVQTEIRVGHSAVRRKDPDYFNLLVGSYVLGGGANSRLNQILRVERGLTYGAYASIRPRKGPGSVYSVTETRTEKTVEALNLIFEQIESLRTKEVAADELGNSKAFIIGSFPLSIELPTDQASRLTNVFLYDLGDNYLKTYRDRLAAVSAGDVLRVSKEKMSAQNVAVVLVGKAADFRQQVEALGKVEVIPIDKLNLDSPTLK